jgi:hypothetical protein
MFAVISKPYNLIETSYEEKIIIILDHAMPSS